MSSPKGLEHGTRIKAYSFDPNDLVIIGLDTDDGPEHPDYDPRIKLPIKESLVKNILRHGVLQPINIAVVDGQPVVVDGRQRVRHAREANKRLADSGEDAKLLVKVPCKTVRSDANGRTLIGVTTNTHRANDNPVAEARKAAMLSERECPDEDICNAFGWSIGTLRNRRKLLELTSKVLKLVEQGKLSVSAALELHGNPKEFQEREAEKLATMPARGQAREAQRRKRNGAPAAGSGEEDEYQRPGIRLMVKVLEANDEQDGELLSDDVVRTIRWVLGTGSPTAVKGLSACINTVNQAAQAAAAKRREAKGKKKAPPRKGKAA